MSDMTDRQQVKKWLQQELLPGRDYVIDFQRIDLTSLRELLRAVRDIKYAALKRGA